MEEKKDLKQGSEDYQIKYTDRAIAELVYDKIHLVKAYNYYSGIRDSNQFQHLEENYGIGTPTNVMFTPLIRKHIDALVGEYLTLPIEPGISCKDQSTMKNIYREKQLHIAKSLNDAIRPKLESLIYSLLKGDGKNKINDKLFELELNQVRESAENNFISEYEIAALHIIEWIKQSRLIDLKDKLQQLVLDLFIAGEVYYDTYATPNGDGMGLKVLNPMNCFPDPNPNSKYICDSYRFVYREYLSYQEIMATYGKELSREDIKHLKEHDRLSINSSNNFMMLSTNSGRFGNLSSLDEGILSGYGVSPTVSLTPEMSTDLYCVYHTLWIDVKPDAKGDYVQHRYKTTKIGSDIYILHDVDENMSRSMMFPEKARLSVNGLRYMSRTGRPYSLMLATADLLDLYDYYQFMKSTIIALSGTSGDWVDIAFIPNWLGTKPLEKLAKWLAYKKSGVAMIDSSLEGMPMSNTTFSGFDDTVKLQAILAVDMAIQDLENTAMQITGVYRERLGGLQPRDAVSNVETGLQQSYIVTKQYFRAMDLIEEEILLDLLNLAKEVFKDGLSGTLILGNERLLFKALPEHFTMTDFDVHIHDSQDTIKERTTLQQISMELIKGGMTDPELLLAIASSKSLTLMKLLVSKQIAQKRQENNQLQQLTDQLQLAQQQMLTMQQQLQQAQKQLQQFDAQELNLKKEQMQREHEIALAKIKSTEKIAQSKLDYEKKRVDLEIAQCFDNNPYNDKIKYD